MGSNSSKSNSDISVHSIKNSVVNNENPDPRSPTPEISRTPLHNKPGTKHNITKNVDLRKTFESTKDGEEKLIHNNPILSAVIKNHLQSYDPRSPTQDFERTPIIIGPTLDDENDKKILRLKNNNHASPVLKLDADVCDDRRMANEHNPNIVVPKNLCDGFFDLTLDDTLKYSEEPLGSSTASNEAIENNISTSDVKPTKFLETNFDYIEAERENFEDSEENGENNNHNQSEEECKTIPLYRILGDDPRSPSVGIDRTPMLVSKVDEDVSKNNVEEMSDDTLIKVLQSTNTELRQTVSNSHNQNAEGLMIYEDESSPINSETPKKSKSANNGCRTPLSCMKNKTDVGHVRSKSANTLLDPKGHKIITSKIPKRVSNIPRLKILTKQTKLPSNGSSVSLKNLSRTAAVSGDCENTPPHSHRDRWDKDNSIVL